MRDALACSTKSLMRLFCHDEPPVEHVRGLWRSHDAELEAGIEFIGLAVLGCKPSQK
jgi:hypothetical protein